MMLLLAASGGSENRITGTRLSPCPNSPNCISSFSPQAGMQPLQIKGSIIHAKNKLLSIIESMPAAKIAEHEGNYLRVEFTSAVFSFIDDVEFEFNEREKLIHFRSASRSGYYDFGVNKRRMERITKEFNASETR
jgi:uncharacterized protein (DUF1499 family)